MGIGLKIGLGLNTTQGAGTVFVPGVLTAAKRSFTLAGQDVGLLRSDVLVADAASFTLSGQDASFATPADSLGADAGVFVLAGQNVTLTASAIVGGSAILFNNAAASMYLVVIDDF